MLVLSPPAPALRARRLSAAPRTGTAAVTLAGIVGVLAWYLLLLALRPGFFVDEGIHVPAVWNLLQGNAAALDRVPMLPTYHYFLAHVAGALGAELWTLRLPTVLLSWGTLLALGAALRSLNHAAPPERLLLLVAHPLLLPVCAVVYTDIPALLPLLVGLTLHCHRRYRAAALFLAISAAIRQSHIVWFGLFLLLALAECEGALPRSLCRRARAGALLRAAGRSCWPYLCGLAIGAGLLVWHGPATRLIIQNHPQFNPAQFFLLGLAAAVAWLPIWLPHVWQHRRPLLRAALDPALCVLPFALAGMLALSFRNPHEWNMTPHFIHNWPLATMTLHAGTRFVAGAVIVVAGLALAHRTAAGPRARELALIWLVTVVFLIPHYFADPRYYLVPFLLVDLFSAYTPAETRRLAAWYLGLTLAIGTFMLLQPWGCNGFW